MKPVLITLGIIVGIWFGASFFIAPFSIPSSSMSPMLNVGDRILVDKTAYRTSIIPRGDVVVFDGQDSFSVDSKNYVKRVIGIGGDEIQCCDDMGYLLLNGSRLEESAYLFPGDSPSDIPFRISVPEGKLWLMGDHRSQSADSRSLFGEPGGGFVPETKVIGRARAVLWPPVNWKTIE